MMLDWTGAYRGCRVLLTGNTGFKGVWLTAMLNHLGARVAGISRRPDSKLFSIMKQKEKTIYCDIRDPGSLVAAVHDYAPDIVFHLAGQALVRKSYNEPLETFEVNAQGTVNLLEAIRSVPNVKAAVAVTTDKVYAETTDRSPRIENDRLGGKDLYSASKACAELVIQAYRDSFFENGPYVASARAGNVIGGGDWADDRLIPDFVRSIEKDIAIELRNPHHVRPWQHVLEPVRGYLMLGQRLLNGEREFSDGWNFGPSLEDALSVSAVAEKMIELWGKGRVKYISESSPPHENAYLKLDSSKANSKLSWNPVLGIDRTLSLTVEWYREYFKRDTLADDLVNQQIEAYLDLVEGFSNSGDSYTLQND